MSRKHLPSSPQNGTVVDGQYNALSAKVTIILETDVLFLWPRLILSIETTKRRTGIVAQSVQDILIVKNTTVSKKLQPMNSPKEILESGRNR